MFLFLLVSFIFATPSANSILYRACVLNSRGSVTGPDKGIGAGVGYLTLQEGLDAVTNAAKLGCDFLEFPELAFEQAINASRSEVVVDGTIPSGKNKPYQIAMSNAAVANNIVIFMNLVEMGERCTGPGNHHTTCAYNEYTGEFHYTHNTVVTITAKGSIQIKYRKLKPMFGLEWHAHGTDVVFADVVMPRSGKTVRMGICIYFDILHNTPLPELVTAGVKHLVYSTQWKNFRAGYADLPVFQGISEKYGLTIIAAGSTLWASGSAIFQNGKVLAATSGDHNVVLSADIEENGKEGAGPRGSTSGTTWKFNLLSMNTRIFPAAENRSADFPVSSRAVVSASLKSSNGIVCTVSGKLKADSGDKYIIYLRRGTKVVDLRLDDCGVQVCNRLNCTINMAFDTTASSVFNQLEITMSIPKSVFSEAKGFLSSSRMTNDLMCPWQGGYAFSQVEENGMVVGRLEYKRNGNDNDPLVNAQVYGSFALW